MRPRAGRLRLGAICLVIAGLAACAVPPARVKRPPGVTPDRPLSQTGIASWYGPGFHGQATASGAIYNQNQLTAAHRTLPLGTRVMVTNLTNGRTIEVAINDRGPFAKGRVIDLSQAAAAALDMLGPGTARVRVEVIETPYRIESIRAALDYTLQVGSFAQFGNAQQLRDRLQSSYPDVAIVRLQSPHGPYYRVQLGTFPNRAAAEERAHELAQSGYSVIVMEK